MMNIYQVLPRLYGAQTKNSSGKLDDFTDERLQALQAEGYTHIWFTGLLEHATQTAYPGIPADNPAVVKGKAGSPYAVKDYYDIAPSLAVNPENRMKEFEALLKRTHKAGLKLIMDFVPNHVARQYHSDAKPKKVCDLGQDDDVSQDFSFDNDFYYCSGEQLQLGRLVEAGLITEKQAQDYTEAPAKATGNDCFSAWPGPNDWYETVKLNYGGGQGSSCWTKMTDILLFWAKKGVDGFRCDMAEMVPCNFWHYAIGKVREKHPDIVFIAEVYNPSLYHSYIHHGGFDYLYDKVGLYDTLRAVMTSATSTHEITKAWQNVDDIRGHMLYFLENHDEQRIASDFFAGNPWKARPAMAVAALMGPNPLMIYAGQEVGERGMDAEGYSGVDGRTTIFDYWVVKGLKHLFTGKLTKEEKSLREFYDNLLELRLSPDFDEEQPFYDLMYANTHLWRQYAFFRGKGIGASLVVANFEDHDVEIDVHIPEHAKEFLELDTNESRRVHVPANDYVILK